MKRSAYDAHKVAFCNMSATYYRELGFFDMANMFANLSHAYSRRYIHDHPPSTVLRMHAGAHTSQLP